MNTRLNTSLNDEATFAGQSPRGPASEISLSDARTLCEVSAPGIHVELGDIEVVDLESRYRIEGSLGQGGMGAVLLATDTRLDRKVAIKRILGDAAGSRIAVQRFLTEAKAIAALSHPNIVQIHDYGRAKDGPFLIMEYVDGGSLADRCKLGAIALAETVRIAFQICDGLTKAHGAGLIHRDIKPANVLLTKDGIAKLTDFGVVKAVASDLGHTATGRGLGTPDFMPPEQRGDASLADERSDLWSLAATVYQMVTARSPRVISLRHVPSELHDVLSRALEDRREDRYQTVQEFRRAIEVSQYSGAGTPPMPALAQNGPQEGQCISCGTIHADLSRKYCRNHSCAAVLQTDCLKCKSSIPVWDGVCGECGSNQWSLLCELRQTLEAKQLDAEAKLAALAFDEAQRIADEVLSTTSTQLADIAAWGREFLEKISVVRTQEEQKANEAFRVAKAHRLAFDYPAAISTLERVPGILRSDEMSRMLTACRELHQEAEHIIATVVDRVKKREFDGLLPALSRACELRGDRRDIDRIRVKLTERRDNRLTRARNALQVGDSIAALAAVAGLTDDDVDADGLVFLRHLRRIDEIEARLSALVRDSKAAGAISPATALVIHDLGHEYLCLNPRHDRIRELVAQARGIAEPLIRLREYTAIRDRVLSTPTLRNTIDIELRLLAAGSFGMGPTDVCSDKTPTSVELAKPFYIGVTVVTNAQWKRVMRRVPSRWRGDSRPVERVSWDDALEFCSRLSSLPEEKDAGRVYRLPTEAEWEYACRAGTTTGYSFGDDSVRLGDHGWFELNSGGQTHPVGLKKPNGWGLYDMHGNVWEWCSDGYDAYQTKDRVIRGGGWSSSHRLCRSDCRDGFVPSFRDHDLGFRVVLKPPAP